MLSMLYQSENPTSFQTPINSLIDGKVLMTPSKSPFYYTTKLMDVSKVIKQEDILFRVLEIHSFSI